MRLQTIQMIDGNVVELMSKNFCGYNIYVNKESFPVKRLYYFVDPHSDAVEGVMEASGIEVLIEGKAEWGNSLIGFYEVDDV